MLNTLKEFIYMRSKLIIINGLNYIINFILDNLKDFFIYLKNSNILNIGFGMVLGTQITLFVSAVLDYIFKKTKKCSIYKNYKIKLPIKQKLSIQKY